MEKEVKFSDKFVTICIINTYHYTIQNYVIHDLNCSFLELFPVENTLPPEWSDTYDNDVFQHQTQMSEQDTLYPQLINNVPLRQRPAVSAVLQQRQAQRVRSKSMIHQHPMIESRGKISINNTSHRAT